MTDIPIIVASQNPVKIACVKGAFRKVLDVTGMEFIGTSVPSQVSAQPLTDKETLLGAQNRVKNARDKHPNAEYWVGIEGGIEIKNGEMSAFAWVVIESRNQSGKARTGVFYLPNKIAELVRADVELGHADDIVFQRKNSKQKDGAIGILTKGVIDRTLYYEQAVIMALIPFINPELYAKLN